MRDQSTRITRGDPTVPTACRQCSETFLTWAYKLRIGRAVYCSDPCYRLASRVGRTGPPDQMACAECGASFRVWPYQIRAGRKYCSRACKHQAMQRGEQRTCEICGSAFYFGASRARLGQAGRFCSHACNGVWSARQRESISRDSASNKEWRAAVRERDRFICQQCGRRGTGRAMHAHHIQGWHAHPALRFDVANGITLCRSCHASAHGGPVRR